MGVVYRAWQQRLNRMVALKRLRAGAQASTAMLARFRVEAEAVARLQHPNIVQIHHVGQYAGSPFLVLELVEGPSLAQSLAGTPQPIHQAVELVEVLARAIHAVHVQGSRSSSGTRSGAPMPSAFWTRTRGGWSSRSRSLTSR
jgi:serine/threonine protein kinase